MSADKYPSIFSRQLATIVYLYNNQINARALIGQKPMFYLYNNQINARALIGKSAVGYCAGKPTQKSRVL